jgi:MscS family membrane protein
VPDPGTRALVVLLLSIPVAGFVDLVARKVLARLVQATETELDDDLLDILRHPVALSVVFGAIGYGLSIIDLGDTTRFALRGLFVTGVVVYWGRVLLLVSDRVLEHFSAEDGDIGWIQPATMPLFTIGANVVVYGGAVYFILLAWDVDVTAWLASAGIVGIAVGFAAKDTLANLFAGLFILADRPYKMGDYLVLESGERGRVTHIGIRTTRLQTNDDVEVIIPNAEMANARIVNESGGRHEKFRIKAVVEVAYGTDIDLVRRVLTEVAQSTEFVIQDDRSIRPRVRFMSFGASGLVWHVLVWVPDPRYLSRVLDRLNTNIYKRLMQEGLEIPYSKHDVYLYKTDGPDDSAAQ